MLREHIEWRAKHSPIDKYILENGREFEPNAATFKGRRMKANQCFRNATLLVLKDPALRYVEGYFSCHGVPLHHGWVLRPDGTIIDPTIKPSGHETHIGGYFGVPFETEYLKECMGKNGYYGVLDGYYNRHTIVDLIEGKNK